MEGDSTSLKKHTSEEKEEGKQQKQKQKKHFIEGREESRVESRVEDREKGNEKSNEESRVESRVEDREKGNEKSNEECREECREESHIQENGHGTINGEVKRCEEFCSDNLKREDTETAKKDNHMTNHVDSHDNTGNRIDDYNHSNTGEPTCVVQEKGKEDNYKEEEEEEHYLSSTWAFLYDKENLVNPQTQMRRLVSLDKFNTIEQFYRNYKYINSPSTIQGHYNVYLFKKDYKPILEEFPKGLLCIIKNGYITNSAADIVWEKLVLLAIGTEFNISDFVGVQLCVRDNEIFFKLWIKYYSAYAKRQIRMELRKYLDLPDVTKILMKSLALSRRTNSRNFGNDWTNRGTYSVSQGKLSTETQLKKEDNDTSMNRNTFCTNSRYSFPKLGYRNPLLHYPFYTSNDQISHLMEALEASRHISEKNEERKSDSNKSRRKNKGESSIRQNTRENSSTANKKNSYDKNNTNESKEKRNGTDEINNICSDRVTNKYNSNGPNKNKKNNDIGNNIENDKTNEITKNKKKSTDNRNGIFKFPNVVVIVRKEGSKKRRQRARPPIEKKEIPMQRGTVEV